MRLTLGILITYFNERNLLRDCLDSLLAQTEKPDEVFVYDDASDAPAEGYIPRGFSVKVIRGEANRGPSYARNTLLRISQNDYVHFHDADDLFHPEWCQRVRKAMEETEPEAVFTEVSSCSGGDLLNERVLGLHRLLDGEDLVRFCIHGAMLVPAGTYRREVVLAVQGYRDALWQSEDFDFHIRLGSHGISYILINDPLVTIRVRSSGRSQNRLEVWASALQAIAMLATELPSQYKTDLADAAARAGSALFNVGAHSEARKAFCLAQELGPPTFSQQRRLYRVVARTLGPEIAEHIATLYRRLPGRFRGYLAEHGW